MAAYRDEGSCIESHPPMRMSDMSTLTAEPTGAVLIELGVRPATHAWGRYGTRRMLRGVLEQLFAILSVCRARRNPAAYCA